MKFETAAIEPAQIDYGNGRVYPAIFDFRAMLYLEEKTGTGHIAFAQKLIGAGLLMTDSAWEPPKTGKKKAKEEELLTPEVRRMLAKNTYTINELAALAVAMHRNAGVEIEEEQFLEALNLDNYDSVSVQLMDAMVGALPEGEAGDPKNLKK